MWRTGRSIATIAAAVAVLVACGGSGGKATSPVAQIRQPDATMGLEGTAWVLTSLSGNDLRDGTHITLSFDDGEAGEYAGCNGYGSEYTTAGDGLLTIRVVELTLQACEAPDGVMAQETAYIEAFSSAAVYRVDEDRLEIGNAPGRTTLIFARREQPPMDPDDLVGTRWRLLSLDGNSPLEESAITIVFHGENRATGDAGCRGYVAAYHASPDDFVFTWLAMTGELCAQPELVTQEGRYTTVLEGTTAYQLAEQQLELLTTRGEVLSFEPLPAGANASLEGTKWALTGFIETKPVEGMTTPLLAVSTLLADSEITLTLDGGTARGSAGCNSYSAGYSTDGASLTFGPMAVTEMACLEPDGLTEQELLYLSFLGDMITYSISGSQLWADAGNGRSLLFVAQE